MTKKELKNSLDFSPVWRKISEGEYIFSPYTYKLFGGVEVYCAVLPSMQPIIDNISIKFRKDCVEFTKNGKTEKANNLENNSEFVESILAKI